MKFSVSDSVRQTLVRRSLMRYSEKRTFVRAMQSVTLPIDYSPAIALLKQADPVLALVIDRVGECTLSQSQQTGNLLSCLAESILYQQLSGKAAATIHRRFLLLYPDPPPSAEELLNTPDEVLRSAGISRPKITYLKDLAQKVLDGLPSLETLNDLDDEAIITTLTQVKGIGRWTAQMLLMFRLHRWDVLPVDDLGIRTAILKAYELDEPPNRKAIAALGQRWQPYSTIACWYLWRSLETPGRSASAKA